MTSKPYPEVDANPDFAKIEEKTLAFWKEEGIFRKSIENRPATLNGKNNEFVFYDGPPFANGLPHYGHLLTGFVKDTYPRYQTMKGKRVERRFGWDCHGLPAEMAAEKELNISGTAAITEYGIEKFNDYCRTSVMRYAGEWETYVTRAARWVDFEHDYKTMNKDFMESVMWAFKQLYDKGLIYEAYRVMPYSWAAETPLSNFETRLDNAYRERVDKAVTVAFTLKEKPAAIPHDFAAYKLLAWTTTPWTLPSNLALAVNPEMDYVALDVNNTAYILAAWAMDAYAKELGVCDEDMFCARFKGSDLLGLHYEPLFPYFKNHANSFKILSGDFVEQGSGTGVVHLAPGFGEDDQRVCEAAGIELVCPVDSKGAFTSEIFDLYEGTPSPQPSPARGEGVEHARDLRQNSTEAEKKLWELLRNRQLEQYKFRRQEPIDRYIVDFVSYQARLIIELDGGQHAEDKNSKKDAERTAYLQLQNFKVIRFWNHDMLQNPEGVLQTILAALPPSPLAGEGRGEGVSSHKNDVFSLKGLNVFDANDPIIKHLKTIGAHIKTEQVKHNYPHCWRTDQPLIYKAVPSWYVEVTKFKDRMVELNQKINWIPSHVRDGLFGKWLENARDWSISRNRFWGSPIPVWRTESGKEKAFGSIKELEDFFGVKVNDLHRPFIDTLTKTVNGETYKRVPEVFDCWFESGSMPYGQVHYPFENRDWFEHHNPADFIVEYTAQTRGWFYTLMVLSTALFDRPPFLNCICHGVVLDAKGQKLSKRLNNYPDPKEVFNSFGADALRWLMLSSPVMRGQELYIDKEGKFIRDAVRLYVKPLWNAYNFFTMYANADGITAQETTRSTDVMDRYILAKLKDVVEKVDASLAAFDSVTACDAVTQFFDILNNWYIRRNKERFWKEEKDADKQAAYDTLYTVLTILTRAVAPLLPLVTEEIYRGLRKPSPSGRGLGEGLSVHLADWPDVHLLNKEEALMEEMDRVRDLCNAALAIRNKSNRRVRQPLARLDYRGSQYAMIAKYRDIICDEINVKEITADAGISVYGDLTLKVNSAIVGKRLPAKMKEILPASKKGEWKQLTDGRVEIVGEILEAHECIQQFEPKPEYKERAQPLSTNDALVILDTTVTPELEAEGTARDLVRMIQQARKDAGLNVSDRIALALELPAPVAKAVKAHSDYIAGQVLATELTLGKASGHAHSFQQQLDGEPVTIAFSTAKKSAAA